MTRTASKITALIALFGLSAAAAGPAYSSSLFLVQESETQPAPTIEAGDLLDPTARDADVDFGAAEPVQIETASGVYAIQAEIAQTPDQLQRGLMWRESLAPEAGMLFIYEPPRPASMGMRNTPIALDIVYIDSEGVVGKIIRNAQPRSLRTLPSDFPVAAVLELAGGQALTMGLRPGDLIRHKRFANLVEDAPVEAAEPGAEPAVAPEIEPEVEPEIETGADQPE